MSKRSSTKKGNRPMSINMSADVYYFMQTSIVDNVLVPPPGQNWILVEWRAAHALWACELRKLPPEIRNRPQAHSAPSPAAPYYPPMGAGPSHSGAPIQPYAGGRTVPVGPDVVDAEEDDVSGYTAEELGADPSTPAGREMIRRLQAQRGGE